MNDVMIDLETLDTEPSAQVVSCGAVMFDPRNNLLSAVEHGFYQRLEWDLKKRSVSADTIKWWFQQDVDARAAVVCGEDEKTAVQFLTDLKYWLPKDCKVWGNGATFDISMLENMYRQYEIECPWDFWNVRDVRTVVDMAYGILGRHQVPFDGTPHHALHDAHYQAKYVTMMWQSIMNGRAYNE